MADVREVFTILEDSSSANGVAWPARAEGDTVAGNHAPVVTVKDKDGNYQLISSQQSGESMAGDQLPVLPCVEQGGTFVNQAQATEGESVSGDETPVLPCKDASGNWAHIPINAEGKIPVTSAAIGSGKSATGSATPGSLNNDTTVATLTLTVDESYERIKMSASSFKACLWTLVATDDVTDTELARGLSGPGDFSFEYVLDDVVHTAGASGTQELNIIGQQLYGGLSDMHGVISALELV